MLESTKLEAEITQIERELEILRSRYALMERWAKVTMYVVRAGMVIVLLIGMYGILTGEYLGAAAAGLVLIVLLLCVVTGWGRLRWIDLISWPAPRCIWQPWESEAAAIERMIAEREARLAVLKSQARSSPIV